MDPRSRVRHPLCRRFAIPATLIVAAACSSGESGAPLLVPSQPIAFSTAPGRGLANPWSIVPSADGATLLVLERAAGRVARVDVATGTLTRIRSPEPGTAVIALEPDPTGDAALALVGTVGEAVPPLWQPEVSGSVFRLGIQSGDWELVLNRAFAGTGFFVDVAGTGAYTWRNGIDHIRFDDGSRERLDGCADFPATLIAPSGDVAYARFVTGPDPYTGPIAEVSRCDRMTGETRTGIFGTRAESLALGCGAQRLYRAREYFSGFADGADATVLYDVLEASTLTPIDSLDTATATSELRPPGGPAAASGDCTSVWFGTPSGVFAYDMAARQAHRVAQGGAAIAHLAAGDRSGTVLVAGGTDASDGPFRADLATGALEGVFGGGAAFGDPMTALASSTHAAVLWIAVSPFGTSSFPPYLLGDARIDRIDLTTGLATKGSKLDAAHVSGLSVCGDSDRVFGIGSTWTQEGAQEALLFELHGGALARVRSLGATMDTYSTLLAGPGNGRLVMSQDCSTAYVLGDQLYRVPVAGGAPRIAFQESGDAAALDPRQDLLVVADQLSLYGIDLRNGTRHDLAYLTERALDLTVTRDGKVAWTGRTSLGLGVIDLVAETSARLWEGAGLDG